MNLFFGVGWGLSVVSVIYIRLDFCNLEKLLSQREGKGCILIRVLTNFNHLIYY